MTNINRSVRPFCDIAEFIAQETAATTDDFHAAFASNLEGIRIGRGEEEMATDMPDPREAQLALELIVTTLFDVLRDTRLQPAAERLAWGIVNSFHHVADQWAGQADKATRDVQDLLRCADGSEIHGVELEQARDNLEFLDEATDALRCMRDYAADVFHRPDHLEGLKTEQERMRAERRDRALERQLDKRERPPRGAAEHLAEGARSIAQVLDRFLGGILDHARTQRDTAQASPDQASREPMPRREPSHGPER